MFYGIPRLGATLRYSLGALTLFSLGILVLSGLWLGQFYNPSPAGAHDSVQYIISRAPFGDFARSLHHWAATIMVITIVGHVVWGFMSRAYRAPREVTWYVGLGLAALTFLMVATGTILGYDQEGYEALAHFLAGAELAGPLGRFFASDYTLSTPVLARVFSLHTSLFPLLAVGLLGIHLWLVRQLGISAPGPDDVLFVAHLRRISGVCFLLFAGLLALATFAPEGLGYPPVPGYEVTKPFWALLWVYALESLTGMWALVWAPAVVFLFLAAVPLVDRGGPAGKSPPALRVAGAALLAMLLALGLWAALSPPQQHLGM